MLGCAALIVRPFTVMSARIGAQDIHVPDAVMHELEVPLTHAGLQIDSNQALREQVVAGTRATVVVVRRGSTGR